MRWPVILGISVLANIVLVVAWLRSDRETPAAQEASLATNSVTTTNVRTAVVVRRQFFSWQEVESRDYPTYIKNLRDIGCPEQTIRDIIVADVTAMLREKYLGRSQPFKPNPKWWTNKRDEPDTGSQPDPIEMMWVEREAILKQLLGPEWAGRGQTTDTPNAYQALILATMEVNPVLRAIPTETKAAVAALMSQALEEGPYDPAKAVALEKARWAKVGELLPLNQVEALRLHFSTHAENLRQQLDALPGFNTQADEFRKIFRATDAIDEQLLALGNRTDAPAEELRQKLVREREAALQAALPRSRYELYVRLQDPAYLRAMEQLAGDGNPAALAVLYAINREAATEEQRIQSDASLTAVQREIELKRLELEQLKATALALGEEVPAEATENSARRAEPMKVHSVLPGEGLERIARIYGVPPEALRAANPNLDFSKLPTGAAVNVPLRMIYPLPPPPQ